MQRGSNVHAWSLGPPAPTLFISQEVVAYPEQWPSAAWQPLPWRICLSIHLSPPALRTERRLSMSHFFPCCLVLRLPRVEIDRQGMLTHKSICGIEEGHHFELSIPHSITTSRATAGQCRPDSLGMCGSPKEGLGYQSWKCGGMSAQLCELDSHQCMKALLNKPHSLRSQPAFPIGHGLAPSCIPALEEAEGPGLFVLPKSGLRTMTG